MKRFLIYAASFCASALMLTVSCQKPEPVDPGEPGNPDGSVEFNLLSESEMQIPYQGGNDTIFYELKNAVGDGVIDIIPKDGWIGSFDTSVDGQIAFTVEENPDDEERTCTLRVSYLYGGNNSVFFEVTVTQAAVVLPSGDDAFEITVDENSVTFATADCHVVPADQEMSFISMVVKKSIVEDFVESGDDEAWFEDDMLIFAQTASMYGVALRDYVEGYKLQHGTLDYRAAGLTPSTEYWCYAYGMEFNENDDPVMLTSIVKKEFTTKTPESDPDEFVIEVSAVGEKGVQMLVIPYSDDVLYYYDNINGEYLDNLSGTIEERLEEYSYNYISPWLGYYTIEDFGWFGSQAKTFWNIESNKTYYAYAYILEADGSAKDGKVWYQEYTMESLSGVSGVAANAVRPEYR